MTPVRLESAARPMVGLYSAPENDAAPRIPILMCNPFGQEAIRCHRVFRVLADRLARAGHPVLRFDYHGTGDSPGDDDATSLQGWTDDILEADARLRSLAGRTTAWLGLRLGATAAAFAAARTDRVRPDALILWDPVLDGRGFARELERVHVEQLERVFGMSWAFLNRRLGRAPPGTRDEAMGFPLPAALCDELARLAPATFPPTGGRPTLLVDGAGVASGGAGLDATHPLHGATVVRVEASNWNSEEAMNTAIVPSDVVNGVLDFARTLG